MAEHMWYVTNTLKKKTQTDDGGKRMKWVCKACKNHCALEVDGEEEPSVCAMMITKESNWLPDYEHIWGTSRALMR